PYNSTLLLSRNGQCCGQVLPLLIHRHQLSIAMLNSFAGQSHARLRRQDEAISQDFRTGRRLRASSGASSVAIACFGLNATTQTFHSRSSSATNRVKVRIASLLTTYGDAPWFSGRPPPHRFTLFPERRSSINGTTYFVQRNVPPRLVWITLSQKSLLRCRTRGQRGMPQLKWGTIPASLINASIWSKRSMVSCTSRRTSFSSRTSVGTAIASASRLRISASVLCMRSRLLSARTSLAPALASVCAA